MAQTVLVVEEHAAVLAALVTAFGNAGYAAMGAQTFRDALNLLATKPSILVAGVRLGPYNGLHLLLRGKADCPDMHGIVTGPADGVTATEAMQFGAAAYLTNPLNVEAVLAEVTALSAAEADDEWPCDDQPPPPEWINTSTPA